MHISLAALDMGRLLALCVSIEFAETRPFHIPGLKFHFISMF